MSQDTRERIETLVLVTVISVLVWLFAEGEVVQPYERTVQVRFVAPSPEEKPLIIEPQNGEAEGEIGQGYTMSVRVALRASKGQMQELQQRILGRPLDIPVTDPTGQEMETQTFDLRQRLAETRLGQLGANMTDTKPSTVTLNVEPVRQVPLRVDLPIWLKGDPRLADRPTVKPTEVQVRVPASRVAEFRNREVTVALERGSVEGLEPGKAHTFRDIPLRLSPWLRDVPVELVTDQATVTLTLEAQAEALVRTNMPVYVVADARLLEAYTLRLGEANRTVGEVRLKGPGNVIEKIRDGELEVRAVVRPTLDAIEAGDRTFPVRIERPPDVNVESELPEATLDVAPR